MGDSARFTMWREAYIATIGWCVKLLKFDQVDLTLKAGTEEETGLMKRKSTPLADKIIWKFWNTEMH